MTHTHGKHCKHDNGCHSHDHEHHHEEENHNAHKEQNDQSPENVDIAEGFRKQIEQLNEKLLRVVADSENEKKRAARDADDRVKFALTSFARDLTDSIDVLFISTLSIDEAILRENELLKKFYDGIEMVKKSFVDTIEKHGINRLNPALGDKFDHNYHQAVAHIPHSVPSGTIAQVMKSGYTLNGRPLKHAMVAVSSGMENNDDAIDG